MEILIYELLFYILFLPGRPTDPRRALLARLRRAPLPQRGAAGEGRHHRRDPQPVPPPHDVQGLLRVRLLQRGGREEGRPRGERRGRKEDDLRVRKQVRGWKRRGWWWSGEVCGEVKRLGSVCLVGKSSKMRIRYFVFQFVPVCRKS